MKRIEIDYLLIQFVIIQFMFSFTIIHEYHNETIKLSSDHELITIRLLTFIALSVNIWIEYKNGRKNVILAIYSIKIFI